MLIIALFMKTLIISTYPNPSSMALVLNQNQKEYSWDEAQHTVTKSTAFLY
jgi:hypothetical protein